MMRITRRWGLAVAELGLVTGATGRSEAAASLTLRYSTSPNGAGLTNYDFTLGVDESTGPWSPGQGWTFFTFGDADHQPSPLSDFVLTRIEGGPWSFIGTH